MDKVRRLILAGVLVWFLVFAFADAEDAKATSKSPYNRYWDRVKSTINHLQVKYLPPDLDFRSIFSPLDKEKSVTEAASKSFRASKKTVEETAKSAAGVVEEAAQVTAEKVKAGKTPTSDDSHHSEL